MGIGTTEIILIFIFVFIFFGAKRLPEIAKSFGKGIKEFKKATKEIKNSIDLDEHSYTQSITETEKKDSLKKR